MKKKLFKKASTEEMKNKATVGGYNHTRYVYINGYYEAGKSLIEIAIGEKYSSKKDTLFYPICYNYRHYLELHLKSLIIDCEILYDKMDKLGYLENGTLTESVSDTLDNTHNLYNLLEIFLERLTLVSSEVFPLHIKKYIKQMYDMDSSGQRFRYYIGTDKRLSFPDEEQFDLGNILKTMNEVHDLLWGVDGWLDYHIQMSNGVISDYEESMESYYH